MHSNLEASRPADSTAGSNNRVRRPTGFGRSEPSNAIRHWRLVGWLGEGTWTNVYRACAAGVDAEEAADYVIKLLKPEFADDPLALQFLQREAAVAGDVQHVNVVSVLARQLTEPPFHLVTPWLAGAAVDAVMRGHGTLSTPHALWVARQTAEGLRAMHRRGWRHGDVKPHNLLLSVSGHVTLLDLGFAERLDAPRTQRRVMASPAYAAPEIFHSTSTCDAASDIYSLGITLFEMLTKPPTIVADSWQGLAEAHREQIPPDARRFAPMVPARVCQLIRHMLTKQPLRRPTIDEVIDRLVSLEIATLDERAAA